MLFYVKAILTRRLWLLISDMQCVQVPTESFRINKFGKCLRLVFSLVDLGCVQYEQCCRVLYTKQRLAGYNSAVYDSVMVPDVLQNFSSWPRGGMKQRNV